LSPFDNPNYLTKTHFMLSHQSKLEGESIGGNIPLGKIAS
jgi:hypothetical protein